MTATRSRKQSLKYDAYRARLDDSHCQFCTIKAGDTQLVAETAHFKVVHNLFPYSFWDSQRVVDHLMILPKQHTDTLKDLTPNEAAEFVQLMSDYENQGYNVYARAPSSSVKTVVHQHTHLIKTAGGLRRLVFMLRRPYVRIVV